jgi:hypothetical protein
MNRRISLHDFTIISGGNTGADIAALRVAKKLNMKIDGFASKNYWTTIGANADLKHVYNLKEMDQMGHYAEKEGKNLELSDGLLAFRVRLPQTGKGTESTINLALNGKYKHEALQWPNPSIHFTSFTKQENNSARKPVLVLWDLDKEKMSDFVSIILDFIFNNQIEKLMISGPVDINFEPFVEQLLETVFQTLSQ